MPDNIFDIRGVTLQRGGQFVLDDVSLRIERSASLMIIGPSGSGKSSLLRCLNRLETINSGQIMFAGTDIAVLPVLELRQRVGMVFQKAAVFPGTVADNIAYGPGLRGQTLARSEILDLMRQAALEADLIDRDARELSGGQEQRLAIARALANQPEVLLLDEATTALDPIATHKVEEILLRLRDERDMTLIWVSHNIEQTRRVADRVLLLESGRVVRHDTVAALLDADNGDSHTLAFARGIEET